MNARWRMNKLLTNCCKFIMSTRRFSRWINRIKTSSRRTSLKRKAPPRPPFFLPFATRQIETERIWKQKGFNSQFSKLDHKELYFYQLREIDRIKSEGSVTIVQILSTDPRKFFFPFFSPFSLLCETGFHVEHICDHEDPWCYHTCSHDRLGDVTCSLFGQTGITTRR